jgi:hypothetical protein
VTQSPALPLKPAAALPPSSYRNDIGVLLIARPPRHRCRNGWRLFAEGLRGAGAVSV